ncbi:MAG: hypothetical protein WAL63_14595 [Solirubrobacteraceae bacterium]
MGAKRTALTTGAALCAAVVTGCGGHAATKPDVVAQANAICASALRDERATPPPATGQASLPALSGYLQQVLPIVGREVSNLHGLPRPAEDRALLDRYLDAVTDLGSTYRSLAAAARRGDQDGVDQALAALQANPASSLAVRYGLIQCAGAAGTAVSR